MLVVDHLTRMSGDRICVAVIDPQTGDRLRPVLYTGHWTRADVPRVFEVGAVLEPTRTAISRGPAPMVEDWIMGRSDLRRTSKLDDGALWDVVRATASASIAEALPGLEPHGATYRHAPHTGAASLAALRLSGVELASVGADLKIRFEDRSGRHVSLPLTDLRFHPKDLKIDSNRLKVLRTLINREDEVVLSIGLSREFNGWHWLQANNVHLRWGFADHPVLSTPGPG